MIDVSKYTKVAEYKDGNLHWLEDRDINAVYLIMIGDDSYIGSSKYLYTRIQEHVSQLRRKEHTDKMQEAFDSKGCFDVYSIERGIDERFLLSKEMQYIRSLNPTLNINGTQKKDGTLLRIKEILNNKGMTAKELAVSCGLSEMGLSKILTGKSSANTSTIIKIAEVLGVKCGELFDDYTEPSNEVLCPYCGKPIKITLE